MGRQATGRLAILSREAWRNSGCKPSPLEAPAAQFHGCTIRRFSERVFNLTPLRSRLRYLLPKFPIQRCIKSIESSVAKRFLDQGDVRRLRYRNPSCLPFLEKLGPL